jgi:hypothetical protein
MLVERVAAKAAPTNKQNWIPAYAGMADNKKGEE